MASATVQLRSVDASRHEIAIAGRLYGASAGELRTSLEEIAPRASVIIVDATRLEAIDATALRVFVDALKQLRPRGGRLIFFGLTPANRRLFEITGLDRVATVAADRAAALEAGA